MAENRIIIGEDVYTDSVIRDGNVYLSSSLAADELSIGTLDTSVDSANLRGTIFRPKNSDGLMTADDKIFCVLPYIRIVTKNPVNYEYGQTVKYYHGETLKGIFYVSSVERTGKYTYSISCVDAIGLLDSSTHYGGIYNGITVKELAEDIGGNVISVTVSDELEDFLIYGYLPIDTRRNNLHQLLFAIGAIVNTVESFDEKPSIYIEPLKETDPRIVPSEDMYIGGSVELQKQINRVIISEHAYAAYLSDAETSLYEGDVPSETITTPMGETVQGIIVKFDAPMHDLTIEGGEILESNANYAVISPSASCKLFGLEYTHTTRQVIREINSNNARSIVDIQDNEAVVENATLVSILNSENVADRVMSYYSSAKTIKADIISNGQDKPGSRVSFTDPFDEESTGYIKSMDITMSGKLKANAEIVEGYVPTGIGNNYTHVEVLTGITTTGWICPEGVTRIRVVLIGGGYGGHCGEQGQPGTGGLGVSGAGEGGEGGKAGDGGNGGKIFIATLPVTPLKYYPVIIGKGQTGQESGSEYPSSDDSQCNTSFSLSSTDKYSSGDGTSSEAGYVDILTGIIYANPGGNGLSDGGKSGDTITFEDETGKHIWVTGERGETVYHNWVDGYARGYGGYGGGPAFGNKGLDGGPGKISGSNNFATGGTGGQGGQGRNGESGTKIGEGGQGGCGGGGGGGGGEATHSGGGQYAKTGDGGAGGLGGNGGNGAVGGILIYY